MEQVEVDPFVPPRHCVGVKFGVSACFRCFNPLPRQIWMIESVVESGSQRFGIICGANPARLLVQNKFRVPPGCCGNDWDAADLSFDDG